MNNRRSFLWKLGAGASAAVAVTVGPAGTAPATADNAAQRAALLEEEMVLRRLHHTFVQAMDKGLHEQVIGMFADDAQVLFNGGLFSQRRGVSRLFREHFPSGKTGRSMEPAPGFELTAEQQRDSVAVAADRRSAQAAFPYSIQVGAPLESENSLAAMARLHGEGVRTWWEGGVYRVNYRKDSGGRWLISRLEYDTLSRADYRAGRSYARPIAVARFDTCFPGNQTGPDALV
jgi:hypothetical protein